MDDKKQAAIRSQEVVSCADQAIDYAMSMQLNALVLSYRSFEDAVEVCFGTL